MLIKLVSFRLYASAHLKLFLLKVLLTSGPFRKRKSQNSGRLQLKERRLTSDHCIYSPLTKIFGD
jgi:hypothetical protein